MNMFDGWILTESKWKECEAFEAKNRRAALKLLMDTYKKRNGTVKVRTVV